MRSASPWVGESEQRWIVRLAGWTAARGGIFLFVLPLALTLIVLRGLFTAQRSWADFVWYAIYFVIGYIMPADERFTVAIERHGWKCLAVWLVGFSAGVGLLVLVLGYDPFPGRETFSWRYVACQIVWSLSSWSAVVFMLGIGARYLNRNHRVLVYANEAVLPFYLFHQTVILVVGFFIVRWNLGILPKLLIVTAISFPLTLALHELLVRRFNTMRFLFGMRPRERRQPSYGACSEAREGQIREQQDSHKPEYTNQAGPGRRAGDDRRGEHRLVAAPGLVGGTWPVGLPVGVDHRRSDGAGRDPVRGWAHREGAMAADMNG